MSFAGHVLDSIKRTQYNRSLLKTRRARYNKLKEEILKTKSKYHTFHDKSNLSSEELNDYKRKIKKRIRNQKLRTIIISSFITLFILLSTVFIIKYLYHYHTNQK